MRQILDHQAAVLLRTGFRQGNHQQGRTALVSTQPARGVRCSKQRGRICVVLATGHVSPCKSQLRGSPWSCCTRYQDCHESQGMESSTAASPLGGRGGEGEPTGTHRGHRSSLFTQALGQGPAAAEGRALSIQFRDQLLFQHLV